MLIVARTVDDTDRTAASHGFAQLPTVKGDSFSKSGFAGDLVRAWTRALQQPFTLALLTPSAGSCLVLRLRQRYHPCTPPDAPWL